MKIVRSENIFDFKKDYIDVNVDEHTLSYGETLVTSGVAPCIVVAAHNSKTNMGFMGHASVVSRKLDPVAFQSQGHGYVDFEHRASMLRYLGPPDANDFWIGGGGWQYDGEVMLGYEQNRAYVEQVVSDLAVAGAVTIEWNEEPDTAIWVMLDPLQGALTIGRER